MLFPLYPIIFQDIRGLKEGVGDLPFLATLGGVLAAVGIQYLYQIKYMRDLKANHGKHRPELRLAPCYLGGPIMAVALVRVRIFVNGVHADLVICEIYSSGWAGLATKPI